MHYGSHWRVWNHPLLAVTVVPVLEREAVDYDSAPRVVQGTPFYASRQSCDLLCDTLYCSADMASSLLVVRRI